MFCGVKLLLENTSRAQRETSSGARCQLDEGDGFCFDVQQDTYLEVPQRLAPFISPQFNPLGGLSFKEVNSPFAS